MKILVIGSGGREHALIWKLRQSPRTDKIYCAPGNGGIGEMAELVSIQADKIEELADFATKERIDLTVVGPEIPLTLGIADRFEASGLRVFGPNREAAQLEGSKGFAKDLMAENDIPTARFATFTDSKAARAYAVETHPCVVKADGLAAGKGVRLCFTTREAEKAVDEIMVDRAFGTAGQRVVIEELLTGEETSFMALTDGDHFLSLATSQDHKAVFDGDRGPNTGGMGAYSPAPVVGIRTQRDIEEIIIKPVLAGLRRRGICYRGVLYLGLMITADGPKVLEFNARFGDPECQPLMMRLKGDLVPLLEATIDGKLDRVKPEWYEDSSVCVVLCSRGYPGSYDRGREIQGLESLSGWDKGFVFHSGTERQGGRWLTSGGRVLGVTARGNNIDQAVKEVYGAVSKISWEGVHYRRDIAHRALSSAS